jgi:glycosyltransferase involved in cell wall biosynthesis
MPRVSVIIPTHNRAALVGRAAISALAQTFTDLEVLIVDDASSDGTGEAVLKIGDPRVRYVRHETNRGVSAARNTAIAGASGQFIAFLDDDDEWLPEKLGQQLDHFARARDSVGLITTGYQLHQVTARAPSEMMPSQRGWVFERLLRDGSFNHTSTVLARAECFDRVGRFDESVRYGEDFDMWLRIAREYEVDFVPALLVRVHPQANGLTQDYAAKVAGAEAHLDKYRGFFERNSRLFNERLRTLGTDYCFAGDTTRGRQAFYRAIAHRPLAAKSYACAALSLLGAATVRSCYRFKDRCSSRASTAAMLRDAAAAARARIHSGRAVP